MLKFVYFKETEPSRKNLRKKPEENRTEKTCRSETEKTRKKMLNGPAHDVVPRRGAYDKNFFEKYLEDKFWKFT